MDLNVGLLSGGCIGVKFQNLRDVCTKVGFYQIICKFLSDGTDAGASVVSLMDNCFAFLSVTDYLYTKVQSLLLIFE